MEPTPENILNFLIRIEKSIDILQNNFELLDTKISVLLEKKDSIIKIANIADDLVELNKNKSILKELSITTTELLHSLIKYNH